MASRFARAQSTPPEVEKSRWVQPVLRSSLLYQHVPKVKHLWGGRSMPAANAGSTSTEDGAMSELDVEVALQAPKQPSTLAAPTSTSSKAKGTKRVRPGTAAADKTAKTASANANVVPSGDDDDDEVIEVVQPPAAKRAKSVPRSTTSNAKASNDGKSPTEVQQTVQQPPSITPVRPTTPGPFAEMASLLTTPSMVGQRKALLILIHDASKKTFHRLLDEQSTRTTLLQTIARKIDAEVSELSYMVGDHRIVVDDDDDFNAMREYVLLNHFRAPVVVSVSTLSSEPAAPSKRGPAARSKTTAAVKKSANASDQQRGDEMDIDKDVLASVEVQNAPQEIDVAGKKAFADAKESKAAPVEGEERSHGQQKASVKPITARTKKAGREANSAASGAATAAPSNEDTVAATDTSGTLTEADKTQKKAPAKKSTSKKADSSSINRTADEPTKDPDAATIQTQGKKDASKATPVSSTKISSQANSEKQFCKLCWTGAHHPDHCPVISAGIESVMKRFEELREMGYNRSDGESDAFSFLYKYIESFKLPGSRKESAQEVVEPAELASPSKKSDAKASKTTGKEKGGKRKKTPSPTVGAQAVDESEDGLEDKKDGDESSVIESDSSDEDDRSSSSEEDTTSADTSSDESESESSSEEDSQESSKESKSEEEKHDKVGRTNGVVKSKGKKAVANAVDGEAKEDEAPGTTKKSSQKSSSYGFTPLSKLNPRDIQIKATSNGKPSNVTVPSTKKAKKMSDTDTDSDSESSSSSSESSSDESSPSAKKSASAKSKSGIPASKRAGASTTANARQKVGRPRKSLLSQMGLVEE